MVARSKIKGDFKSEILTSLLAKRNDNVINYAIFATLMYLFYKILTFTNIVDFMYVAASCAPIVLISLWLKKVNQKYSSDDVFLKIIKYSVSTIIVLLSVLLLIVTKTSVAVVYSFGTFITCISYNDRKLVKRILAPGVMLLFLTLSFYSTRILYRANFADNVTIGFIMFLAFRAIYKASTYTTVSVNKILDKLIYTESVKNNYNSVIHSIVSSFERISSMNIKEEEGHTYRLSDYSDLLASKIQLSDDKIQKIKIGATLHDFGKIGIDKKILSKPDVLTDAERKEMNRHTTIGFKMINGLHLGEEVENVVLHHHEKWDGTGYPSGLKGRDIPIEARVVAIADVYDALRSSRAYKKGWSHEQVVDYIDKNAGTQFDPVLTKVFKENAHLFNEIYEKSTLNLDVVIEQ